MLPLPCYAFLPLAFGSHVDARGKLCVRVHKSSCPCPPALIHIELGGCQGGHTGHLPFASGETAVPVELEVQWQVRGKLIPLVGELAAIARGDLFQHPSLRLS